MNNLIGHPLVVLVLFFFTMWLSARFSMAISRYDQRKSYEEAEANAIGTEYVRADLLPASDAARVRALLKDYLGQRVLFYETRDEHELQQTNANTVQLQTDLWFAPMPLDAKLQDH